MPRYLALGDSYTIGEGVTEAERWPHRLVALLRARGLDVDEPHYIARTAWTTDELLEAIREANPVGPFDLVTLMIGVNDQYRGRPLAEFTAELSRVLRRAIGFGGGRAKRVLLVSIPDWGATPFAAGRDQDAIAREIGRFNQRARELGEKAGARWADVTEASRQMAVRPELVAPDGLHPSGAMYEEWAQALAPLATEILTRPAAKRKRRGGS